MEAVPQTADFEEAAEQFLQGNVDQAIVDAATSLFEEFGVKKVSLTDIAKRGGLTRSLIYYYYDGKDGVVESVIERYVRSLVRDIANAIDAGRPQDASLVLIQALRGFFYNEGEPTQAYAIIQESGKRDFALKTMVTDLTHVLGRMSAFARPRRRVRALQDQDIAFALTAVLGYLVVQPDVSDEDLATAFKASLAL